jgi:biotin carboxyl carrier protein
MLETTVNGKYTFRLRHDDGQWMIGDAPAAVDIVKQKNGVISILHKGKSYEAIVEHVDKAAKEVLLRIGGQRYTVAIQEPIDQLLHSMGLYLKAVKKVESVKAPMPGMVLRVLVTPGQQIAKGDGLIILEAMKMENVLKANGPAIVKGIRVQERTAVEKGAVLIDLE